jgi:hypothetical protein
MFKWLTFSFENQRHVFTSRYNVRTLGLIFFLFVTHCLVHLGIYRDGDGVVE